MQITPHIHMLTIPFSVHLPTGPVPRSVNVFLIPGDGVTLIDAGVAGAEAAIFAYLAEIGRWPDEIRTLVLTHSHPDHIGAAAAIRERTGCEILASGEERPWIEDTELQKRARPVPGFDLLVGGAVPVTRTIGEGDWIDPGKVAALEVIATPGHSAGSLSFHIPSDNAILTGDAIPLPGDLPVYDDFRSSLLSLERLATLQGADVLLEAWRGPGRRAERVAEGKRWLKKVDAAVLGSAPDPDPMAWCRTVTAELGLPPFAANPLVARSLASHLRR